MGGPCLPCAGDFYLESIYTGCPGFYHRFLRGVGVAIQKNSKPYNCRGVGGENRPKIPHPKSTPFPAWWRYRYKLGWVGVFGCRILFLRVGHGSGSIGHPTHHRIQASTRGPAGCLLLWTRTPDSPLLFNVKVFSWPSVYDGKGNRKQRERRRKNTWEPKPLFRSWNPGVIICNIVTVQSMHLGWVRQTQMKWN